MAVDQLSIEKLVTEPGLVTLVQLSDQARIQANQLVELIEKTKSAGTAASQEQQAEIWKQQRALLSNIAQLRGLHRQASFAARDIKVVTSETRQEVDRLHLQLQNLYYEQRHLQGEIEACEGYELVNPRTSSTRVQRPGLTANFIATSTSTCP